MDYYLNLTVNATSVLNATFFFFLLTTARSELDEEELKGSVPPSCVRNGSPSAAVLICPPNGSESVILFPVLVNGSLFAVDLKAKRSGAAAGGATGSFTFDANRSGSELLVGVPNGLAEAEKGSSVEKAVLEVCAKKESAANGSEPLNGSPPNGSD